MAGSDWGKRQACKLASFIKPSQQRRAMVNRLLQLNASFIFCFRAKDKVKPAKNDHGKTVIENVGFMPIAGMELVFEMTACCLLMPRSQGIPTWETDFSGEKMVMKLPVMFEKLLTDGKPLSRATGKLLAEWARGVLPGVTAADPAAHVEAFTFPPEWTLEEQGENVANKGMAALQAWFTGLPTSPAKAALRAKLTAWKEIAAAKDA
jgi:hypothetical protein